MTVAPQAREHLELTLTKSFDVDAAQLSPKATLDELGLDSIAIVELIDIMAADLGLRLEDDALRPAMTLDEVVMVLQQGNSV